MLNIGYDTPKQRLSDDELDRRRLAMDISELIRSTPPDISARVGIFGQWGAGKSTVLEMVATLLAQRGYVVVRLNPATSETFADLVAQFADKLVASFMAASLYAEPRWRTWLRKVRALLSSKHASAVVDGLGELHSGAKLANAGLGLLSAWLEPDGKQIRRLREALPESRVLVLIDDLDRCPSSLLPKLLLALRDVLDIERFTFVLAFDEDIVAKALTVENSAWDNGYSFLEKILDFRFLLPEINPSSGLRLLRSEMKARAPYIPVGPEQDVEDLLPSNPRRLKSLVRSIMGLQPVFERHTEGEFSWVDVWLVELLRQESPLAVEKLSDDDIYQNICGLLHRMKERARDRGDARQERDDPETSFVKSLKLPNPDSEARVRKLLDAIRGRGSHNITYVMSFASRAPAITWKEFHECLDEWKNNKQPQTLELWLTRHTLTREDSIVRVVDNFSQALSNYLNEAAEKASRKTVMNELNAAYDEMLPVLDCVSDFFKVGQFATSDRFYTFYGRAQYWVGVHRLGSETSLRQRERATLASSAQALPSIEKLKLLERLRPWSFSAEPYFDDARARSSSTLLEAVSTPLVDEAYAWLQEQLKVPDLLTRLRENGKLAAFKALLFSPPFLPWREDVRVLMLNLLKGGIAAVSSYDFGFELMRIWTDVLAYHLDISREGVLLLIRDDEIVGSVWAAVQRLELMDRGNIVLLACREKLIREGASGEAMPLEGIPAAMIAIFEERKEEFVQSV